ncbi:MULTISPECIES: GGDEF domain-containing protein [unclassified Hahella]|uniref:GGDEF domain-containing protein n=1 Tax=unclassified Hahella TaxID=2624107 RepID=UPI001C1EF111|nr:MULTISPECIES: GGDEF domain-containing protein [unclassified Hahella]MBU6951844.1 GGDEF domain-containing protein [Hahella sp. HN01]MDG9670730.1 GGDEF domain-containing protein [Hahella sp. CR1]
MTPVELNNQLRSKAYSLAAVVAALLALGAALFAEWLMAGVSGVFAGLLLANGKLNQRHGEQPAPLWLSHVIVVFLVLITLAAMVRYPGTAEQWCYIVPLIAFLIYRIQVATIVTSAYSIALALALIGYYQGPEKVQIFFIYLLSLAMSLAFVYLREIKEQQLKPLRRTDNLTLASTREYLTQDLDKEIQRSEREGTDLSILALSIDSNSLEHASADDKDHILHRLGRMLHENLRLFDSYYRYENVDFIILLPHCNSREAAKKASQLRVKAKQALSTREITVTVSLGLATLNVGDTPETLIANARRALTFARNKGANQQTEFLEMESEGGATLAG